MKCPACSIGMDRLSIAGGIVLDFCNGCRGTWFDPGEFGAHINKKDARVTARNCPKCIEPALMLGALADGTQHADFCPDCDGVWFDALALDQLQNQIDPAHPLANFLIAVRSARVQKTKAGKRQKPSSNWSDMQQRDWDSAPVYVHRDLTYKHFQTVQSNVEFVLGEFYWKVERGDKTLVRDFVRPPMMISQETTEKEATWSIGEYVDPAEVWEAFRPEAEPPASAGVFANQPNSYESILGPAWKLVIAAVFAGALVLSILANGMLQQTALNAAFVFQSSDAEKSRVSGVFRLDGHTSNVLVRTSTDLSNAWGYFSMALINVQTGVARDFGREVAYYFGQDYDGAWTEGSRADEVFLPAIEPGDYYLRVEPESNAQVFHYTIEIIRDVPRASYMFIAFGLLLLPPVFVSWRYHRFEYNRWAESDHPVVYTPDEEEDDD